MNELHAYFLSQRLYVRVCVLAVTFLKPDPEGVRADTSPSLQIYRKGITLCLFTYFNLN